MGVEGKIEIDFERCKGCENCVTVCPKEILQIAKEPNGNGYFPAIVSNGNLCAGCGSCYIICGDNCITVRRSCQNF